MVALDAATGATLWSYTASASVVAGAAVVNGRVFWGSGDDEPKDGGTTGNILYAFGF
jgi:polyvinyl alcohol dehydrogenase (cytochrome)